ncbi:helix-turn-helix domain-containing protein [Rhodococcus rhodochrous]|uniref:Helix-turn-helix domain-containing protein n=1 Tax=Rhodococcus rhodochrous TaxID=1829 RepID=A0AA47A6G1_RHORH|nr:helix-turn-helix domain-containing protein [Rhodococcus rhodochrous]UZF45369.1 helix-turn-helix domain-containing protein [Rhodococcus rhodochrous]
MAGGSLNKFAWLEALRGADLTHAEYRVAVNLSTYARADLTNAHPSLATLCSAAHVSVPTAKKALRRLAGAGWIVLTAQGGNAQGFGKANCYSLTFPKGVNGLPPLEQGKGVTDLPPKGVSGFREGGKPLSEKGATHLPPINEEISGEINENPGNVAFAVEPRAAAEPDAPTSSVADLFGFVASGPVDVEIVDEPTRSPVPSPASGSSKVEAPEKRVTKNAYERVGKAFNFIAVQGIAKWAIREREESPERVESALVGIHELGRPITKQTVGQWLDGTIGPRGRNSGPSRQDEKVRGYLEIGERLKVQAETSEFPFSDYVPRPTLSELKRALPSSPAIDPTQDPLGWIDGELPGGLTPDERDHAAALLSSGTAYSSVRWKILDARNTRPKNRLRRAH